MGLARFESVAEPCPVLRGLLWRIARGNVGAAKSQLHPASMDDFAAGLFYNAAAFDIPLRTAARAGTRQKRESQQGIRHPKGNEFVPNCLRRLGGEAS